MTGAAPESSTSSVDVLAMEKQLALAIQEYKSLQARYSNKLKSILEKHAQDGTFDQSETDEFRDMHEALETSSAAIESELQTIGSISKREERHKPEYLDKLKVQAFKLQCALKSVDNDRVAHSSWKRKEMANDAAMAASLLQTESSNTWMMFMLFISIALVTVAMLSLFKPAYISYAYVVVAICTIIGFFEEPL